MQQEPTSTGYRYLALGDSYTIGEAVPAAECWPRQLNARLAKRGIDVGQPQLVAKTGWSVDELSDAVDKTIVPACSDLDPNPDPNPDPGPDPSTPIPTRITPPYDLVSLSIGVNNQYRGWSLADFAMDFQQLLNRAISFSDDHRRVFVVSIPDWGVSTFAQNDPDRDPSQIAAEIDQFNATKRRICAELTVPFVDITPISRALPQLIADDGLHPSGAQYAWWVVEIEQTVMQMLEAAGSTAAMAPVATKPSTGG